MLTAIARRRYPRMDEGKSIRYLLMNHIMPLSKRRAQLEPETNLFDLQHRPFPEKTRKLVRSTVERRAFVLLKAHLSTTPVVEWGGMELPPRRNGTASELGSLNGTASELGSF